MSLTPNSSQEFVLPDAESEEALVELSSSSNFFNILSPCSVENSCILEDIDLDLQCEEDEDVDSCLLEHLINHRNLTSIPSQDSSSPLTLFQPFNFASYQKSSKVQSGTPTPSPDTEFRTSNDAASETKLASTPSVLPHTRLEARPINNSWENLCLSSQPDKASPEVKHLHPRLCSVATNNDSIVKSDLKRLCFPSEVKPHSFDTCISNSVSLKLLISLKQTKESEGKLRTLQTNKDSNSCDSKNEIKHSYGQKFPSSGIIECSDTSGNDVLLMCNECKISFSTTQALQSHNNDKHVVKKEHKWHTCWECGRTFKYEKVMKRHQLLHTLQKTEVKALDLTTYQCSECAYSGKSEALLRAHVKSQHNPDRTKYFCEKCEFSCLQERTFYLHRLQHDGDGKFACDQCGKLFLSMGVLKRHAHTHSKARPYVCPWEACGKAFTMRGRLTDHMRRVHKQGDKPAKLDKCGCHDKSRVESRLAVGGNGNKMCCSNKELDINSGEIFEKSENALIKSGKTDVVVHDIILPRELLAAFSATKPVCKRRKENFLSSQTLQEGVDAEIPTMKKFTCSWERCGKTFRDNFNLRLHMCTHTGEMQKACPLCRYRCVQKSALDSHMKTHVRNRKRKTKL